MVKVEMRKLRSFPGYDKAKEFCISPRHWNLAYGIYVKALDDAKEMAKNCNDICVAIVHDDQIGRKYVLASTAPATWEPMMYIFNAKIVDEEEGEIRVIVTSEVTGSRVYEVWLKYEPGSQLA